MSVKMSVVVATYNRGAALVDLLRDLAAQTVPAADFEVVVIDDGSREPVAPHLEGLDLPYQLTFRSQANAGAAAARHAGIELAVGEIIVITDDDMRLAPDFLAQHAAAHAAGATVVLGNIRPAANLAELPVFERFHADQLDRFVAGVARGAIAVHGVHVCTGNVSFRRADYLRLGGFDRSLGRSEDRDLGIRLEQDGAKLAFSAEAKSTHESDHADLNVWLKRARNYGVFDRRIAGKHPDVELADPWRFYGLISPISRPLMWVPLTSPAAGERLARAAIGAAMLCDRAGLGRLAVQGTTLTYGLQYFGGVREDAGSFAAVRRDLRRYRSKRRAAQVEGGERLALPRPPGRRAAVRSFLRAVRGDYAQVQRYRAKYHGEAISLARLPVDLVRKVGFQTNVAVRAMQLARDLRLPVVPQVISRLIRHLYAAEIHWDADIAPGLSVVHGVGLVISHAASVGEGCILFHNVTLGEGIDPETRAVGAPTLERDVHVGPGASLIGPITVGAGTKIAAGAVLTRSVPPHSVVRAPDALVAARGHGRPAAAAPVAALPPLTADSPPGAHR